eukprot:Nitzschia sp. Nitz4//scaffold328_size19456//15591//16943//NITZ4_008723-RA/size19456-processed-gene-0.12-mRNA-1//1//CDS//3329547980//5582//frame0
MTSKLSTCGGSLVTGSQVCKQTASRSLSSLMNTKFRDNADAMVPVYVNVNSPHRDQQLREVAQMVCPFLSDSSDLSIKPLLGGLSNELFVVGSSVLVRIHPEEDACASTAESESTTTSMSSTDTPVEDIIAPAMIDREIENNLVAWLSQQGKAPIFYGRFENGRVEEFYQNVAPLSCAEMPLFASQVAQAMADFHALQVPNHILPPLNPHSCRIESVSQWARAIQNSPIPIIPQLLQELDWLEQQYDPDRPTLQADNLTWLQSQAMSFIHQTVVTHSDCQSLNILRDPSAPIPSAIRLIDFEYAGWNPRASDIANTFCEYCDMNNINADYPREYPSVQAQNQYLRVYVERSNPAWLEHVQTEEDWEECLAILRLEVGRYTLLSHLGWAIWGILKHTGSTLNNSALQEEAEEEAYDYVAYAQHRMEGYALFKEWYFGEDDAAAAAAALQAR